MSKVIIIGAGGHAKVIADIIQANGDELVGFLDDDTSKLNTTIFMNKSVIGTTADSSNYPDCEFIIGIGDNAVRMRIANTYSSLRWHTAIHPSAIVSADVKIGPGTVVMPGAIINTGTNIGQHCIINTKASLDHDNQIGDFTHISPGSTLCGSVTVGDQSWLCAGSTIINNISIPENTIIGAGAVVINNIAESGTYVGIPAQRMSR